MRKYLHIDVKQQQVTERELQGEEIVLAGRYFIAKTLCESGVATVDPLSADNPLIFSAGPFAGSNFSNANRTSVGCKSPLTSGIKEANGGGSFGVAMGQLHLAGFTLTNAADDWVVIHITKDGEVLFDPADDYMGKGNFQAAELLHEKYGNKVSLALCGPVGEYQGLLAGIAFSDTERRPSRLAARGGVGAVMGSKKVKAIVLDLHKMPTFHERKKVIGAIRKYGEEIKNDDFVDNYRQNGTASMADYTNYVGGLPVNNFTAGRQIDTEKEVFKMGGTHIREQNIARGGDPSHACMPGCLIQCSNIYADTDGKEIVSPVEYETIGLMGTNCGLTDPDDLARLNYIANDLGIDSIETGATLGVLLDAGLAEFGDVDFLTKALEEIRAGSEDGKLWAQGTARVGEHYNVKRVPVIKKQAISAYDPRVIEVTGLTMMVTAQGADHTAGNVPTLDCRDKELDELVGICMSTQIGFAATDSLGLCLFGRSVTNTNLDWITQAINDAHGTDLEPGFFNKLGRETLKYETEFNKAAGFSEEDDELPEFFYTEALAPSNKVARFHSNEVNQSIENWWENNS